MDWRDGDFSLLLFLRGRVGSLEVLDRNGDDRVAMMAHRILRQLIYWKPRSFGISFDGAEMHERKEMSTDLMRIVVPACECVGDNLRSKFAFA